tara:strand:- start:330 stop:518 length:189 start_codon:yes stop_codon:yes gene_type:complete
MTKNPHTKNKNVLKIKPTSADTVVSAAAGIIIIIDNSNVDFINFIKDLIIFLLIFKFHKNFL